MNTSRFSRRRTRLWSFDLFALSVMALAAQAKVVTYPAPAGETLSTDYQVLADGNKVDVYSARTLDPPFAGKQWDYGGPYSFANFDLKGHVTVTVTSARSLRDAVVRPASRDVKLKLKDDHTALITFRSPRKVSFEPDGKRGPLLLFANPLEANPPKAGATNMIYFGPGIHQPGAVKLGDNQTVYLAGGALVKGAIVAQGTNLHILGRGILDGSDFEWRKGPNNVTIGITGTNVTVSGITVRGSSHWTIVPFHSRDVTVRNVKLCGGRVQNDDGINPCNSRNVLITDCFIRTDDDCVAMKGLNLDGPDNNVENIVVEDCTLWCDRARIFLLGHESRAPFMRNITLRNLDLIHFTMTPFLFEPGEEMRLENVRVENIRIHGAGQREIARLKPVVNQYMVKQVPGHVRKVLFKNVTVSGAAGKYQFQLQGADAQHRVTDVTFDRVRVEGQRLKAGSPRLIIGENVDDVRFQR